MGISITFFRLWLNYVPYVVQFVILQYITGTIVTGFAAFNKSWKYDFCLSCKGSSNIISISFIIMLSITSIFLFMYSKIAIAPLVEIRPIITKRVTLRFSVIRPTLTPDVIYCNPFWVISGFAFFSLFGGATFAAT